MFSEAQKTATRDVFWLAGYNGELRTRTDDPEGEITFVLPEAETESLRDEYVVERVLTEVLGSKVSVLYSVGEETSLFRYS